MGPGTSRCRPWGIRRGLHQAAAQPRRRFDGPAVVAARGNGIPAISRTTVPHHTRDRAARNGKVGSRRYSPHRRRIPRNGTWRYFRITSTRRGEWNSLGFPRRRTPLPTSHPVLAPRDRPRARQSDSTISCTSSRKPMRCVQPSFCCALTALPRRRFTSAGRYSAGSAFTYRR